MKHLAIDLCNKSGETKIAKLNNQKLALPAQSQGQESCYLAIKDMPYEQGDYIKISTSQDKSYLIVQLDEALTPALLFVEGTEWHYHLPLSDKERESLGSKPFSGNQHFISVRYARDFEIAQYGNLALNTHDQKEGSGGFPHAYANVETRNDSTFFAKNAIDGMVANNYHGSYPYQSWGINQQKDAALTIDFGREVVVDQIALVLRGDYPHDSYWTQVTVDFSDDSREIFQTHKEMERQYFSFPERRISRLTLKELIKAEDESPFPALTQIEVFGRNAL